MLKKSSMEFSKWGKSFFLFSGRAFILLTLNIKPKNHQNTAFVNNYTEEFLFYEIILILVRIKDYQMSFKPILV